MQVELLGLVLLQPDRRWTLDELTGLLGAPTSSIHRELLRAAEAGIVERDVRQRPHLFRAATDSPLFDPMRTLLQVTVGGGAAS